MGSAEVMGRDGMMVGLGRGGMKGLVSTRDARDEPDAVEEALARVDLEARGESLSPPSIERYVLALAMPSARSLPDARARSFIACHSLSELASEALPSEGESDS